jgi:hypothetical protein
MQELTRRVKKHARGERLVHITTNEFSFVKNVDEETWLMPDTLKQYLTENADSTKDSFAALVCVPNGSKGHYQYSGVITRDVGIERESMKMLIQVMGCIYNTIVKPESLQFGKRENTPDMVLDLKTLVECADKDESVTLQLVKPLVGHFDGKDVQANKESEKTGLNNTQTKWKLAPWTISQLIFALQAPSSLGPLKKCFATCFITLPSVLLSVVRSLLHISASSGWFLRALQNMPNDGEKSDNYGPQDVFVFLADNMGFREKGGFLQTCLHSVIHVPFAKIKESGLHLKSKWVRPDRAETLGSPDFTLGMTQEGEARLAESRFDFNGGRKLFSWQHVLCNRRRGKRTPMDRDPASQKCARRARSAEVSYRLDQKLQGTGVAPASDVLTANNAHMLKPELKDFSRNEVLLSLVSY